MRPSVQHRWTAGCGMRDPLLLGWGCGWGCDPARPRNTALLRTLPGAADIWMDKDPRVVVVTGVRAYKIMSSVGQIITRLTRLGKGRNSTLVKSLEVMIIAYLTRANARSRHKHGAFSGQRKHREPGSRSTRTCDWAPDATKRMKCPERLAGSNESVSQALRVLIKRV